MTKRPVKNLAASVRARLFAIATREHIDFQAILVRYVIERFLWRLGNSAYKSRFYLKGSVLLSVSDIPQRPTRDVDLLGHGSADISEVLAIIEDICAIPAADGIAFRPETAAASRIREEEEYQGVRVQIDADIDRAIVGLQVDIGFGDVVTPAAREVTYATLLDMPAPVVLAYPLETMLAEKFEAMVKLKLLNSRLKDFYDLHMLASTTPFQESMLSEAIRATFKRRGTPLPVELPVALSHTFGENTDKKAQWASFLKRNKLAAPELLDVIANIRALIWPVVESIHAGAELTRGWEPVRGKWIIG